MKLSTRESLTLCSKITSTQSSSIDPGRESYTHRYLLGLLADRQSNIVFPIRPRRVR
jgi:hypothetical protein